MHHFSVQQKTKLSRAHKGVMIIEDECLHFSKSNDIQILHQLPDHQAHLQGFTEIHMIWHYHMSPIFHFAFWEWKKNHRNESKSDCLSITLKLTGSY